MDVVSDIAFPLPAKIIAEMLGVPAEDWDIFQRWARFGGGRENEGNRHQPKPRMSPGRPGRGKKNSPVIPLLHHCHPERSEGSRSPSSQTLRRAQGDMVR